MEHNETKVRKVSFAQPHDADAQEQGVETVKPPELFLMQTKPLDQSMVPSRAGDFEVGVGIRHRGVSSLKASLSVIVDGVRCHSDGAIAHRPMQRWAIVPCCFMRLA